MPFLCFHLSHFLIYFCCLGNMTIYWKRFGLIEGGDIVEILPSYINVYLYKRETCSLCLFLESALLILDLFILELGLLSSGFSSLVKFT